MPTRTRVPSDQGITVARILSQKITKGRNQEWSNTGLLTQLGEKRKRKWQIECWRRWSRERRMSTKEIAEKISNLSGSRNPREVFSDWVTCMAMSIANWESKKSDAKGVYTGRC